jgi:hypothetical protein
VEHRRASNLRRSTPGVIASKWLELLKEVALRVARVVFLFDPGTAPFAEYYGLHIDVAARPAMNSRRRIRHLLKLLCR